jgi:hypothetical protein
MKRNRYIGKKGKYWKLFSRYVRMRDWYEYDGMCISCGRRVDHWKAADAGHFVAASKGFTLLFHERNVNLQCKGCNNPTFTPDAGAGYAIGLNDRYGKGTAEGLWARRNEVTREWTELEYEGKTAQLRDKLDLLKAEFGDIPN